MTNPAPTASTPPGAASQPATTVPPPAVQAEAAGTAPSAAEPVAPVQPRATGVVSKRAVIGKPAVMPATREAAPADPKASTTSAAAGPAGGNAASADAGTAPGSAPSTDGSASKPKEPGSRAEDQKLGKSWADLMDREASLVETQKQLTEAQRALTAEKKAAAEEKAAAVALTAQLKTPGKRVAALKSMGIDIKTINEEYLQGETGDPVEMARAAARAEFENLKKAEQAELEKAAAEAVKAETEKNAKIIGETQAALDAAFVEKPDDFPAIKAFELTTNQIFGIAQHHLGRALTKEDGRAGMEAAQAFFDKRILAAGYVKKSDDPAPAPAPAAAAPAPDITPGTLTARGNSVPLSRKPPPAQTWQERLEEGKKLLGITD